MSKKNKLAPYMKKKLISYLINFLLVVAGFVVINVLTTLGVIDRYIAGILTMVCINIILAVSLNLVTGILGQLVLGHAGFMAVGAYTAALFTIHSGLPLEGFGGAITFLLALVLGGLVAALFSVIIGIPALRLKGDYLAIITLGFGEIIRVLILNLDFTGGALGLRNIPGMTTFNWVYILAALTVYIIYSYMLSRHGRAVLAIREDEIAAEAAGIHTTYYKMAAFVMAAFFAGVAGGLYAHYIGVIAPSKFNFNYSVEILVMVVLGGMGSITGSVIAAAVLTILPEALRAFSDYRMLLYSVVLILMMLFRPGGLLGRSELSIAGLGRWIKRMAQRFAAWLRRRKNGEKAPKKDKKSRKKGEVQ